MPLQDHHIQTPHSGEDYDDDQSDVTTVCDDRGSECSLPTPRTEVAFQSESIAGQQDETSNNVDSTTAPNHVSTPTPNPDDAVSDLCQGDSDSAIEDDDDDVVYTDPDVGEGLHAQQLQQQRNADPVTKGRPRLVPLPPPLQVSKLLLSLPTIHQPPINHEMTTCLHTSVKYIYVGDTSGVVSVFYHGDDGVWERRNKYVVGDGAVHTISTDSSEQYMVAADTLGRLLIQNLTKNRDNYKKKFSSPVTCVSMHPDYALLRRPNKPIFLGFEEGLFCCSKARIYGRNFTKLYCGRIHAITWRKNLVAFACGVDIIMYNIDTNAIISRYTSIAPSCNQRVNTCHLVWYSSTTLYMGWGNSVARLERGRAYKYFAAVPKRPTKGYRVRAVEPLPTKDCILVLVDFYRIRDDGVNADVTMRAFRMMAFSNASSTWNTLGEYALESRVIPRPFTSSMSSHLALNPTTGSQRQIYHISTPSAVFEAIYIETFLDDCVQYLLAKRRYYQALIIATCTCTGARRIPPIDIGIKLLNKHFARRQWSLAAELAEKICQSEGPESAGRLWDTVIKKFNSKDAAYVLIDKLPSTPLPTELFNMVLISCLHHSLPKFVNAIDTYSNKYDRKCLIQCTRAKFVSAVENGSGGDNDGNGGDNVLGDAATLLGTALRELYLKDGNIEAAREILALLPD